MKNENLATAYQGLIDEYLKKGYIRQVATSEPEPESEWFSPHFPVLCPDTATVKVRIVFDASAKLNEKSLNAECNRRRLAKSATQNPNNRPQVNS